MDQIPEYASDVEWLLQSGQVKRRVLIEALVEAYWQPLWQIASIVSLDITTGHALAVQVIANAAVQTYRYPGGSLDVWLYTLAAKGLQKAQPPPENQEKSSSQAVSAVQTVWIPARLAWALARYSALSPEEIAALTRQSSQQMKNDLASFQVAVDQQPAEQRKTWETWLAGLGASPLAQLHTSQQELVTQIDQAASGLLAQRRRQKWIHEAGLIFVLVLIFLFAARLLANIQPFEASPPELQPTQEVARLMSISAGPTATPRNLPPNSAILMVVERAQSLEEFSAQAGVSPETLAILNGLPLNAQLQPEQEIIIGYGGPRRSQITPTPIPPASLLEPIGIQSRQAEIIERIRSSRNNWSTLWVEAQSVEYGPPGYVGPAKRQRYQEWISKQLFYLSLTGDLQGNLSHYQLIDGSRSHFVNFLTGERRITNNGSLNYSVRLHNMVEPNTLINSFQGILKTQGIDIIAGREVLVVDAISPIAVHDAQTDKPQAVSQRVARLWIDVYTGVILRSQRFSDEDPNLITEDVVITHIVYDAQFSNELFDPYLALPSTFASNWRGRFNSSPLPAEPVELIQQTSRQPLPYISPPRGFDPSPHPLTFQWTNIYRFRSEGASRADVFADGYFLGNIAIGDADETRCLRSPDGRQIAFSPWLMVDLSRPASLRFADLANLEIVHEPLPDVSVGDFAFSPDSRRIIFFGCKRQVGCGIYLVEQETAQVQRLLPMGNATSFVWSPDGKQVAMIATTVRSDPTEVWVVDLLSGIVVETTRFDWSQNVAPADSLVASWGVEFPQYVDYKNSCHLNTAPLVKRDDSSTR